MHEIPKVVAVSSCPVASRESALRWVGEDRQQVQGVLLRPHLDPDRSHLMCSPGTLKKGCLLRPGKKRVACVLLQCKYVRCQGSAPLHKHVRKGRVIDHSQEGCPGGFSAPAAPPTTLQSANKWDRSTAGSGYIVSRIQLFIHFWVYVYTSQQPV